MSIDPTETIRRHLVAEINSDPGSREALEIAHGKVWDTEQLSAEFEVLGFMAPFVGAKNKGTGKKGSLTFQHYPRFYFDWKED